MSDYEKMKEELMRTTDYFRSDLLDFIDKKLNNLSKSTKNGIIISGTLLGSYYLVKLILGKSSKHSNERIEEEVEFKKIPQRTRKSAFLERLTNQLLEHTLIFLLGIAREKLIDYLNEKQNTNENSEESSEKSGD